jgi:hypothetical protein
MEQDKGREYEAEEEEGGVGGIHVNKCYSLNMLLVPIQQ